VQQVLDGLGFSRELQESPIAHLSGGQQRRVALGRLLLQEPDLLLLDEPTNHLDLAALEWLEAYLQEWKGALLVVEHDRYFLDALVSRIIELASGAIEEYPGNYTRYLHLREERYERRLREYEEQQDYIQRTEAFIRRYRAGQRSRQARGRAKLLGRLERLSRPQDLQPMRLELKPLVESGRTVLATEELVAGYASAPGGAPGALVRVPDLEIRRGERIALLGPNGSGKTTLLRTLIGRLPPLRGRVLLGQQVRIGYYSQTHEDLHPERTLLDEIREVGALSEEVARDLLARFLFVGDDVFKPVGTLSGGERSRIILARLALQGPNVLVLDEPTNHLDLPARQLLEEVLSAFSGTLLFVSHDRYLIDRLATRLWVIEDAALTIWEGNYTAYRLARQHQRAAERGEERAGPPPAAAVPGSPGQPPRERRGKKNAARLRTLAEVEQEIEQQERRSRELEEALNAAALRGDAPALQRLSEDYETLKTQLDALLAEWERLASVTGTDAP
jgi:ATP-binding cassette subfamily F protein 3